MTIARSIAETFPGHGQVTERVQSQNVNNPINATTTTNIPVVGNPFRSGKVRIRGFDFPGAGAGQCTLIKVIAKNTGATVTATVANVPTFAASEKFDLNLQFGPLEFDAVSIDVAITMANIANGQLTTDFEICVNP
jgi:hypothetical protein